MGCVYVRVQPISRIGSPLPVICAVISALRVTDLGVGPPRTDMQRVLRRTSPTRTHAPQQLLLLFDQFVGDNQQSRRECQPKRFCCCSVARQIKFGLLAPFSLFLSDTLDIGFIGRRLADRDFQSSRPRMMTMASPYSVARMDFAWRPGRPDPLRLIFD